MNIRTIATIFFFLSSITVFSDTNDDNIFFIKENGYKSPELVVTNFVDNFRNGDLQKILSMCAIEEQTKYYDFKKYCQYIDVFNPRMWNAPNSSLMYITMNYYYNINYICQQIKMLTYSILGDFDVSGKSLINIPENQIDSIINSTRTERLRNVSFIRSDFPRKRMENDSEYIKHTEEIASLAKAEKWTERLILCNYNDRYYYFGVSLVRYNNLWFIDSIQSSTGNITGFGCAQEITKEEYEDSLNW